MGAREYIKYVYYRYRFEIPLEYTGSYTIVCKSSKGRRGDIHAHRVPYTALKLPMKDTNAHGENASSASLLQISEMQSQHRTGYIQSVPFL